MIKNIIFDLGGVILNFDLKLTAEKFRSLGVHKIEDFFYSDTSNTFKDYEGGKISDQEFVELLKGMIGIPITDQQVIDSWNAMLIDFPKERIHWLKDLGKRYRLFLFSNTNAIHQEMFRSIYRNSFGGTHLDELFEKAYYSHSLKMRKPDVAAFEFILKENNLKPEETLFVDDSLINVAAARQAGIQAIHLEPGMDIVDLKF
jgi:glucose-1-phosphatase